MIMAVFLHQNWWLLCDICNLQYEKYIVSNNKNNNNNDNGFFATIKNIFKVNNESSEQTMLYAYPDNI